MRFPQDFINRVRVANDIVEVIGNVVQLKKAGASYKGLSPFTKEKTPSFYVNPDKQVFYCFSSGQGGDLFRFLMLYEGLGFSESVERLAERAKLPLPEPEHGGRAGTSSDTKRSLLATHEKIRDYFHALLMRSPAAVAARDYLKSRKMSADSAKRHRLGFSLDKWEGLIQWAGAEKITTSVLEKLGLVIKGKSGFYDRFRGRLMIPIQNEQGRTVAFTARLLKADAKEAKYMNSPETELFVKGRLLFGLDRAKRKLMDERVAVLCEGQIDCITCQDHGFEHVIAPQGTALTEYQARLLRRYADEVVFCFDSDQAGQSATFRNVFTLLREGLRVRAAVLPPRQDPDSFIKEKGPEAFGKLLAQATEIFQWIVPQVDWDDPAARRKGLRQVGELWRAIPDDQIDYKEQIRRDLGRLIMVSQFELRRVLEKGELQPARARSREKIGQTAEETLLAYCLLSESIGSYILGHLEREWLEEGFAKTWLMEVLAKMESGGWEAACAIAADDSQVEEKQALRARLFTSNLPQGKEALGHLKQCLLKLQIRVLGVKIRAKQAEYRQSQDAGRKREIQAEIHDFEKTEHGLRKSLTMGP